MPFASAYDRGSLSWWKRWTPIAYVRRVRHAYDLGGYDLEHAKPLDLDDTGWNFVRRVKLTDRRDGSAFVLIEPEDLDAFFDPHPTAQEIRDYYGTPGACV